MMYGVCSMQYSSFFTYGTHVDTVPRSMDYIYKKYEGNIFTSCSMQYVYILFQMAVYNIFLLKRNMYIYTFIWT